VHGLTCITQHLQAEMAVMPTTINVMPWSNHMFFPAFFPTAHQDMQCRSDTIQTYYI
jgi:hypothetical protein